MDEVASFGQEDRIFLKKRLRVANVGRWVVLLDPHRSRFVGLNQTGQLVLECLAKRRTLGETATEIVKTFGIDREQAWSDLVAFVGRLVSLKLGTVEKSTGG